MRTLDLSPFYRSTVGFDRMAQLLHTLSPASEADNGYPPYNIETVGEDRYRITIAVAGFGESDLEVEVRENSMYVAGQRSDDEEITYLHRGIATRSFKRQFRLADHVKVENVWLDKGLLTIDLVRELPAAMTPRSIAITGGTPNTIADKAEKVLGVVKEAA